MNTSELSELMTRKETRALLRISGSTLQRHLDNGLLQRVRVGRRVFIRREDVLKLMQPTDHVAGATDDLAKVRTKAVTRRCTISRIGR
jgi:excisionase family DNA binding protein